MESLVSAPAATTGMMAVMIFCLTALLTGGSLVLPAGFTLRVMQSS
jgi:hypothetical protein